MDAEMLLRTTLVVVSLFGLPLLALARTWGRQTSAAAEKSRPSRARATAGYRTWSL